MTDIEIRFYLKNNYGTCSRQEACECRRSYWQGSSCGNWIPTTANNMDELKEWQQKAFLKMDSANVDTANE